MCLPWVTMLIARMRSSPSSSEVTPAARGHWPLEAPGGESVVVPARDGTPVGVFTLMGRTFMKPVDDPFRAADRIVAALESKAKVIIVDVHAEATSDKQLLGRYLDGRVSAVLGTHTHVSTADEQIFPRGPPIRPTSA